MGENGVGVHVIDVARPPVDPPVGVAIGPKRPGAESRCEEIPDLQSHIGSIEILILDRFDECEGIPQLDIEIGGIWPAQPAEVGAELKFIEVTADRGVPEDLVIVGWHHDTRQMG